ncbi:MAG TPA: alpha/beta fold hydrolase [Thermomonospora sp.]|nr:alpha/beta fold hydrolase [Thermomonospora sp.]
MPFAALGDVDLFHTDDAPADPGAAGRTPVLLVHGYAADSDDWVPVLPSLAARRRVVAPDLRGHGRSSAPAGGYRPEDLAADLVALLDLLGIGRVVAFGHSMGAMVATALAVGHPSRVEALVCVDPGYGQPPEIAAMFPAMVEDLRRDPHAAVLAMEPVLYTPATPEDVRTRHARKILGTPAHVLARAFPAMFTDPGQWGARPASDAYLARRACPVLTCRADAEAAAWERGLPTHPASRVLHWPGAGHRLHEERPAEFLHVVEKWLETLDKESTA